MKLQIKPDLTIEEAVRGNPHDPAAWRLVIRERLAAADRARDEARAALANLKGEATATTALAASERELVTLGELDKFVSLVIDAQRVPVDVPKAGLSLGEAVFLDPYDSTKHLHVARGALAHASRLYGKPEAPPNLDADLQGLRAIVEYLGLVERVRAQARGAEPAVA